MEKIQDALLENPYIQNCKDTVFTAMLREAFAVRKSKDYLRIKNKCYIHGLLKYPQWTKDSDIFQFIKPKLLKRFIKQKWFFVFDASTEGFSPIYEFPFFDILYYNCKKYGVDPSQIIYVSANMQDEKNIIEYAKNKNLKSIHVFSFLSFERVLTIDDKRKRNPDTIDDEYNKTIFNCQNNFEGKIFSSLSRVNRPYRSVGTFLLCQNNIAKDALISHDTMKIENFQLWKSKYKLNDFTDKQLQDWVDSLPLVVDREDFNVNWAIDTPYDHIHNQTLFQIVNETLVLDRKKTTLFYSEKTFRPVAYFQPFVIYGQPGCNKFLKNLGYHTYDDWFDLSFDDIDDPVERYKGLLQSLNLAINKIKKMSKEEQINWRFKNKDVLIHNFKTMINSDFSRKKLKLFLKDMNRLNVFSK